MKKWRRAIRDFILRRPVEVTYDASEGLEHAPSPAPKGRVEKILFRCDHAGLGLEIGPSHSPIASKRAGYHVEILDHADKETLRKKYADHPVNVENIEDVDYIWTGQPLSELTGKIDHYDWIVASHVIEHTPDFVTFLQQCEIMLKPGGVLCLAIPDQRHCFDIFRPASTPGDIIQAFLEKRLTHSLGTIWDFHTMIAQKGDVTSWGRRHPGNFQLLHQSRAPARLLLAHAQEKADYIDAHSWRFTPSSFKLILDDIRFLDYTRLAIKYLFDTDGNEFIVQLQKQSNDYLPGDDTKRVSLFVSKLRESRDIDV